MDDKQLDELLEVLRIVQGALNAAKPIMAHYPEAVTSHTDAYRLVCSTLAKYSKESRA